MGIINNYNFKMIAKNTLIVLFGFVAGLAHSMGHIGTSRDASTYANIDEARTTHAHFELGVDFENQAFEGFVEHHMTALAENVTSVFFDAEGMDISRVEYIWAHGVCLSWLEVDFMVTRPNDKLGDAVEVFLPHNWLAYDK